MNDTLDWQRIRHLLKIGILASLMVLTGDMLLGWGVSDPSVTNLPAVFTRYLSVSDGRIIVSALLGLIGIPIECLCWFAIYRMMKPFSEKDDHRLSGFWWLRRSRALLHGGLDAEAFLCGRSRDGYTGDAVFYRMVPVARDRDLPRVFLACRRRADPGVLQRPYAASASVLGVLRTVWFRFCRRDAADRKLWTDQCAGHRLDQYRQPMDDERPAERIKEGG